MTWQAKRLLLSTALLLAGCTEMPSGPVPINNPKLGSFATYFLDSDETEAVLTAQSYCAKSNQRALRVATLPAGSVPPFDENGLPPGEIFWKCVP